MKKPLDKCQVKELESRELNERIRFFTDNAPVMIRGTGGDRHCNYFNKGWLDFTGRTLEQELGDGWADSVHSEDVQRCLDTFGRAFDARSAFSMDYRLRRYDSEYRWVRDKGKPYCDAQGVLLGYFCFCIDISELKQTQFELSQLSRNYANETKRLQTLLETVNEGIHVLDADGNLVLFNQSFLGMLGYSEQEAVHLNVADWDVLKSAEQLKAGIRKLMHSSEKFETRHRCKDGRVIDVEITAKGITLDGMDYLYSSSRDISEHKQIEQALAEEREILRNLANITSDYFWELDEQFRFKAISPSIAERSGLDYKNYIGKTRWELPFALTTPGMDWAQHRAVLEGHQPFRDLELSIRNTSGEMRWFVINGDPVFSSEGQFKGYRGATLDITERRRDQERLQQQAMVFNNTEEGIVITDLQGNVINANPAFQRITEYTLDEIRGKNMRFIQSGRHDRVFYQGIFDTVMEKGSWQGEIWNRRKSGDVYLEWLSISSVRDIKGDVVNYIGISIDISRMNHAQSELERLAHHDGLTNLPNRTQLLSRLARAEDRARRSGGLVAVLFVDLDCFKAVNDSYGHKAGDELLKSVADRLHARVREADTLARLGGDEFVIVLEGIADANVAELVARDVIEQLSLPFLLADGVTASIGASVGIALFPRDAEDPARLIELADMALYRAKRQGRGIHRFFDGGSAS